MEIAINTLKGRFGDRLVLNADVLDQHGRDESFHAGKSPDAVVYATSIDEVSEIVKICAERKIPIIPFGVGTSLEGHVAALQGGICLDMSLMNQVLEVNAEDLDCRVQAGVTRKQLNMELRHAGVFFPVDPGADATLGGMTATRASGTNAVRYGTMRENVLGLTMVMPDGSVVKTGGRSRKSAAGYDLTRLMCGSEGTLGVITEIQLKLFGLPEADSAGVCSFENLDDAVNTVIAITQTGIPVARVELLDDVQMKAVNAYSDLAYPEQHTLFFEFHGTAASVKEQSEMVGALVGEFGGGEFQWSTRQEDKNKLWQARHDAYYAAMAIRPGTSGWPTDVCVPISRLTECIMETRKDLEAYSMISPIVGHVGDGNFHLLLLVHTDDEEEMRTANEVNDRLVRRAIEMGGTCTGEHGIGYGKLEYLELEHGAGVDIMRAIKRALDPHNIMNPGKILRN
jgi:D-lactate dehydrogenase (cytochrome)